MPFFSWDGLSFHYLDSGEGTPFVFQHGLGGDAAQPFGLFNPPAGIRLLCLDCRAHGETRPLGDPAKISIASFADDLLEFLDHLHLKCAIVGGISLGAAVALNFSLRHPHRVLGLVLSRPAWLDSPTTRNVRVFSLMARLIREFGPRKGLDHFKQSEDFIFPGWRYPHEERFPRPAHLAGLTGARQTTTHDCKTKLPDPFGCRNDNWQLGPSQKQSPNEHVAPHDHKVAVPVGSARRGCVGQSRTAPGRLVLGSARSRGAAARCCRS